MVRSMEVGLRDDEFYKVDTVRRNEFRILKLGIGRVDDLTPFFFISHPPPVARQLLSRQDRHGDLSVLPQDGALHPLGGPEGYNRRTLVWDDGAIGSGKPLGFRWGRHEFGPGECFGDVHDMHAATSINESPDGFVIPIVWKIEVWKVELTALELLGDGIDLLARQWWWSLLNGFLALLFLLG